MGSISWAFVMTTMSDDSTGKTSFNRKTSGFASRKLWTVEFETQWSAKNRRAIRRRPQIRPVRAHNPGMRRFGRA
jgi:hypothetical protein